MQDDKGYGCKDRDRGWVRMVYQGAWLIFQVAAHNILVVFFKCNFIVMGVDKMAKPNEKGVTYLRPYKKKKKSIGSFFFSCWLLYDPGGASSHLFLSISCFPVSSHPWSPVLCM